MTSAPCCQGIPWNSHQVIRVGDGSTVRQPCLPKCLGCAKAVATFPDKSWSDCVQLYKVNDAFRSSFDSCKALLLKAAANPAVSIQKPFREKEVEIVNIYGKRLQTERPFMTLESFKQKAGLEASEVVPELIMKVKDEFGNEIQGIPLKPDEEDEPISKLKLVTWWEELEVHRDRAVVLWYDLWFVGTMKKIKNH